MELYIYSPYIISRRGQGNLYLVSTIISTRIFLFITFMYEILTNYTISVKRIKGLSCAAKDVSHTHSV